MVDRTGLHTAPVPGNPPLGTAPVDGRLVQGALFGTGAQCLAGGGYTASATSMAFAIAAGVYQIPDTANAGAVYHSPIDGVTLTPAAGQAGGRIDSIYVLQQDYEKNGTTSRVVYGLAAGTPGSGTAPSLSGIAGGPMRLMNITVPATATKATDCTVQWVVPPASLALDGANAASKVLLDLIPGTYVGQRSFAGGVDYRWNGAAWKAWDSDWVDTPVTVQGFAGGYNASNGWVTNGAQMRYRGGRVCFRGNVVVNGAGAVTGQINIGLPVAANPTPGGGVPIQLLDGYRAANASDFPLFAFFGGSFMYTGSQNNAAGQSSPTGPNTPFAWGQSDQVRWNVEYDPA